MSDLLPQAECALLAYDINQLMDERGIEDAGSMLMVLSLVLVSRLGLRPEDDVMRYMSDLTQVCLQMRNDAEDALGGGE